ncbi:interleukin-7 receptor subunit alpha [Oreochromis niloticus]|uniref:Fibronectin type-III domain-containing protein n=2 Tax=Oreochromis TaxID=8139 RepID=I3K8Q0_ORENI|nr:interleukin-7 receptor subunit alpha [Oreochromis niloticus]XP_031596936.1 interleukin-7 receptor subunit alpha [Oreochromis aureus]
MQFGWRIAVMLLLLPAVCEAQSGDGDTDMEPRISCTSHIMVERCNLTCKLAEGRNDDEDDEDGGGDGGDSIERMTLCYLDYDISVKKKCLETSSDTFSSPDLKPLSELSLTVQLKSGVNISQTLYLKNIVKPMSPQVFNITFQEESNEAKIWIQIPYHKDYLKVDNQEFQFRIETAEKTLTENTSSQDFIKINFEPFEKGSKCSVKVRARTLPKTFQGTWSEWSETFTFLTPENPQKQTSGVQVEVYQVGVCLVSVLVVTFSIIVLWKNKIFTYMWPSIPHPKQTLVQICKPNNPLLLTFRPEVFSDLKVYPVKTTACEETEPAISPASAAAYSAQSREPCSTESSDCRSTASASTEELEISALLSRSSSEAEDSLSSSSPSPVHILQLGERPEQPEQQVEGNEFEVFGVNRQEEAYVTMSSFYKIK